MARAPSDRSTSLALTVLFPEGVPLSLLNLGLLFESQQAEAPADLRAAHEQPPQEAAAVVFYHHDDRALIDGKVFI